MAWGLFFLIISLTCEGTVSKDVYKRQDEIIAEIAPAFYGQFGDNITPRNLKAALEEMGFSEFYEVALGADIGAVAEAHHYVQTVSYTHLGRADRFFLH